jgi:hypothetical protein
VAVPRDGDIARAISGMRDFRANIEDIFEQHVTEQWAR